MNEIYYLPETINLFLEIDSSDALRVFFRGFAGEHVGAVSEQGHLVLLFVVAVLEIESFRLQRLKNIFSDQSFKYSVKIRL